MRKSFLIARSNIRKAKGQTIAIIVLILLAALMLNLWLMLSMDYKANFERYHDQLNAEHVTLSMDGDQAEVREFLSQTLENDSRTAEYRLDSCLSMTGVFPYNDGEMNGWLVFLPKDTALSRPIGKAEIVEENDLASGVYLPMLYKSDDIQIGSPIEISIGSHTLEYTVCGFFNSVMMGSHNCVMTELILTEDKYDELAELGYAPKATLCSVRLHDKADNLIFEADLKSAVSEKVPNTHMLGNCYDIVAQSRYISQSICSAVMGVMALLVLLIALVVIASNIINYIQVNMKNLGVLKAAGYTSGQLIGSLLLQFLGLAFLAAVVGAGLSYSLFPAVNAMMISQTGIPYAIRFLPLPFLLSLLILCGSVATAVWMAARRMKRIEPIAALRAGVQTHNFKKNHIPLEQAKVPLHLALALKTTLSGVKHNVTVCITMLLLSLVVAFSGLMTENVIADFTPFMNLIVGETADSSINVTTQAEDVFLQAAKEDSRVEKTYLYTTINVSHVGDVELVAALCDDFSEVNNQNVIFEGRFPKYDNEIAIGALYADEKGFMVGDEIEITANGETGSYLICGLTQISNYLGRDCLLTRQGYERLGILSNASYYLNLTPGTDIDAFNVEMQERLAENANATSNIKTNMESVGRVYISLMTVIVIAILILSAMLIAFVLYLLVRTMLNDKKRDYGILKSLGFTTGQLILQTALSFMPAVILSSGVGLVISSLTINPLLSLFLRALGIVKCAFPIPMGFIMVAGFGLVVFAFSMACLLSLKIRKISPRALLTGE